MKDADVSELARRRVNLIGLPTLPVVPRRGFSGVPKSIGRCVLEEADCLMAKQG